MSKKARFGRSGSKYIPGKASGKRPKLSEFINKYGNNLDEAKAEVERLVESGEMNKEQFTALSEVAESMMNAKEVE